MFSSKLMYLEAKKNQAQRQAQEQMKEQIELARYKSLKDEVFTSICNVNYKNEFNPHDIKNSQLNDMVSQLFNDISQIHMDKTLNTQSKREKLLSKVNSFAKSIKVNDKDLASTPFGNLLFKACQTILADQQQDLRSNLKISR